MGKYKVVAGQNIYDVALHLYGSIEGITDLLISNPALSLDATLHSDDELVYSDDFEIDPDVVAWYRSRTLVPASGERAVYPKVFTSEPLGEIRIDKSRTSVSITFRGSGTLEIDWGDNSAVESLSASDQHQVVSHIFDNAVADIRRIRIFGEPVLRVLDLTALQPISIYLYQPLQVEAFVLTGAELELTFAPLLKGTRFVNLRGTATAELLPLLALKDIADLDLCTLSLHREAVDCYLKSLVEMHYGRRSCRISLLTEPSGEYTEPQRDQNGRYILSTGMEAVWVLTHEQSWNEAGAWAIIIGNKTYTYDPNEQDS